MSDSHSTIRYMRLAIERTKPDAIIHLGDHYDDASALAEEYQNIRFHQVPGNCDRYRCPEGAPLVMYYSICGVKLYMTHGHLHGVKSSLFRLLSEAREQNVQAVLYGHTHCADCRQEDGLWIINPGACNSAEGSVALIETDGDTILSCKILPLKDMEASYDFNC